MNITYAICLSVYPSNCQVVILRAALRVSHLNSSSQQSTELLPIRCRDMSLKCQWAWLYNSAASRKSCSPYSEPLTSWLRSDVTWNSTYSKFNYAIQITPIYVYVRQEYEDLLMEMCVNLHMLHAKRMPICITRNARTYAYAYVWILNWIELKRIGWMQSLLSNECRIYYIRSGPRLDSILGETTITENKFLKTFALNVRY